MRQPRIFQEQPAMDRQSTTPPTKKRADHEVRWVAPPRWGRVGRELATWILALSVASLLSGCQIVIGVMQILNGFPKTTCEFTQRTKKRLSERGKRVIVIASCAKHFAEEPSLDLDVITAVTRRLKADNVTVVDSHKVATWIDDHGGITESTDLAPIGREFAADYIVLFRFNDFGYSEPNSPGMYRGHASVQIVVVEMVNDKQAPGQKMAKIIWNNPFESKYPTNRPESAEEVGKLELFKSKYMGRLSEGLARKFIDYRPEDEI
jgi:hypothetical protein